MVREEIRHAGTAMSTGVFMMQSEHDVTFYSRVFPPPSGPNYRWEGRKLLVDPRPVQAEVETRRREDAEKDPAEKIRQELSGLSDADLDVLRQESGLKRIGGETRDRLIARLAAARCAEAAKNR